MGTRLNLTKKLHSTTKGVAPLVMVYSLHRTPATLANECRPVLSDVWEVFRRYAAWARETLPENEDHLNDVRQALEEGAVWKVT